MKGAVFSLYSSFFFYQNFSSIFPERGRVRNTDGEEQRRNRDSELIEVLLRHVQ